MKRTRTSTKPTPPYLLGTPAPTDLEREFVYMLAHGLTDTGKSTLAFTAPGPLCYIHCSAKCEGLLQAANLRHITAHGYPIQTYDFSFPKPPTRRGKYSLLEDVESIAAIKWNEFSAVFEEAFSYARTIIIDTEYNLYQLDRYAHFGALMPNFKYEREKSGNADRRALWGPVNNQWYIHMRQAVKSQARQRTNVILITHSKDEYKATKTRKGNIVTLNEEKTGNYLPDCQARITSWVDVRIETRMDQRVSGGDKYYAIIRKPWWNGAIGRGTELDITDSSTGFEDIMFEITDDLERWCE